MSTWTNEKHENIREAVEKYRGHDGVLGVPPRLMADASAISRGGTPSTPSWPRYFSTASLMFSCFSLVQVLMLHSPSGLWLAVLFDVLELGEDEEEQPADEHVLTADDRATDDADSSECEVHDAHDAPSFGLRAASRAARTALGMSNVPSMTVRPSHSLIQHAPSDSWPMV